MNECQQKPHKQNFAPDSGTVKWANIGACRYEHFYVNDGCKDCSKTWNYAFGVE